MGKPTKPVNNVKTPPFSSGLWKRCRPRASKTALGPPALGQFWRPSDGIFSRVPRKKVEFWPRNWEHMNSSREHMSSYAPYFSAI